MTSSSQAITESQIYERVKFLEREISGIKIALLKEKIGGVSKKKPISLEGIWKGVEITEEDIKESQKSLFPRKYDL